MNYDSEDVNIRNQKFNFQYCNMFDSSNEFSITGYIHNSSVIHAFVFNIKQSILILLKSESNNVLVPNRVVDFFNSNNENVIPSRNLQIYLVESFENWTITKETTPYIYKLINNKNSLYAKRLISQRKAGNSADGQMIVNTGLLPISNGATCFKYPMNTYPSLSDCYKYTAAVVPGDLSTWNQKRMSDAYHIFDNHVANPNDKDIVAVYDSIKNNYNYNLVITISSHAPFKEAAKKCNILLPDNMPNIMLNYIKSINYMDEQLGAILTQIDTCEYLRNSVVVITGDHNIIPDGDRNEFAKYCNSNNVDYSVAEPYCPLIIYSPDIKGPVIIEDVCYQMDIYPTILHLIGCEDYYWKGFGVNLLDSVARKNRPITEDEAFELSDKIIRADYFRTYLDSLHNY